MTQFSIVTINWNNLEGLKQTYQSVAAQTYRNFRWIVVDGASTDGGAEWLATIDEPYAEITSEPDKGLYDAMNKGLIKGSATEGYTLFLNSGDFFYDENVLQKVADAIERAPGKPRYVYGDYHLQDAAGRLTPQKAKKIEHLVLGMPSSHQAMYFENERLRNVRFRDDFKLSADYCMIVEFLQGQDHKRDVLKIESPLCIFDTTGVSTSRRFDALKEDMRIRREVMKLSPLHSISLYVLHYVHTHSKLLKAALGK